MELGKEQFRKKTALKRVGGLVSGVSLYLRKMCSKSVRLCVCHIVFLCLPFVFQVASNLLAWGLD